MYRRSTSSGSKFDVMEMKPGWGQIKSGNCHFHFYAVGIYTRYHPCLSHDKVFAKLLTSKAILGKRPLEVQVQTYKSFCILTVFMITFMGLTFYKWQLRNLFLRLLVFFLPMECILMKAKILRMKATNTINTQTAIPLKNYSINNNWKMIFMKNLKWLNSNDSQVFLFGLTTHYCESWPLICF